MNYVGKLFSNFKGFYNEINSATLTGAIDIVVVEQEDGTYLCSPFHVRFGKLGVIRSREKIVNIEINGEEVELQMKLGEDGVAFFVQQTEEPPESLPCHLATSPMPSAAELMRQGVQELKEQSASRTPDEQEDTESGKGVDVSETRPRNDSELSVKSKISEHSTTSTTHQSIPSDKSSSIDVEKGHNSSPDSGKSIEQVEIQNEVVEHMSRSKRRKRRRNKAKNGKSSQQDIREEDSIPDFPEQEEVFQMDEDGVESKMPEITTFGRSVSVHRSESLPHSVHRSESLPQLHTDKMNMTKEWAKSQSASYNHPFSDTDITPIVSPVGSRPPTPKSDVEYGVHYEDDDENSLQWNWGQLPEHVDTFDNDGKNMEGEKTPTNADQKATAGQTEKANSGLFTFMRQTKKIRHQPEMEGIYLDDLNLEEMDPEVAALYFPKSSAGLASQHQMRPIKDEDTESGRGMSLPQSPHSVEGSVGGPPTLGADQLDVSMSLCGGLRDSQGNIPMETFMEALITFDDFIQNPELINNPDLVIKIADKFYNWQSAAPIMLSMVVYQRHLPALVVDSLVKKSLPKKEEKKKRSGMSSWFSWGRTQETANPQSTGSDSPATQTPPTVTSPASSAPSSPPDSPQKSAKEKKTSKTKRRDDGWVTDSSDEIPAPPTEVKQVIPGNYKKTLYLTNEQIRKLHLKKGDNEALFFVTTAYQGTTRAACNIYVWRYDDKIVISDIDGTITKSDVLGQILPMVGKDWSQSGVANLYTRIEKNSYRFLYLSARAIGQAQATKDYLRSVKQGELSLPDGPLMLSPSSLINAFHKEVIERKPEEFKISCLRNIKSLFPNQKNPLYAGYGNKINDVWAYRAVDIPISRIFTINPKGELKSELLTTFTSSYSKLSDFVDHLFPPLQENSSGVKTPSGNFHAADQFSNFTYWRPLLPDITDELNKVK